MNGFTFEAELYETLEFMPLSVRYRLDLAGVKLSLAAWRELPRGEREALCAHLVGTPEDLAAFAARAERDAASTGHPVTRFPPPERPWSTEVARDAVVERARSLGARVDP